MERSSVLRRRPRASAETIASTGPGSVSRRVRALYATALLGISALVEAHPGPMHAHGEIFAVSFVAALVVVGVVATLFARRRAAAPRRRSRS